MNPLPVPSNVAPRPLAVPGVGFPLLEPVSAEAPPAPIPQLPPVSIHPARVLAPPVEALKRPGASEWVKAALAEIASI